MPGPSTVYFVEIDQKPNFSVEFEDVDLDDYDTIVLRMRRPDGTVIERDAVIDDADEGLLHFEWETGDLIPGTSLIELVFTDGDGKPLTIPADQPIRAIVRGRI